MTVVSSPSVRTGERTAGQNLSTPQSSRLRQRKMSRTLKAWAFLLPTFIFIGAFCYWPAVRALEGAFTSWDGVSAPVWVGLKNFEQLFHDSVFLGAFAHLFWWSIIGIPGRDFRQPAGGPAHLSFAQHQGAVLVPGCLHPDALPPWHRRHPHVGRTFTRSAE